MLAAPKLANSAFTRVFNALSRAKAAAVLFDKVNP
jgi:hypothetical protein